MKGLGSLCLIAIAALSFSPARAQVLPNARASDPVIFTSPLPRTPQQLDRANWGENPAITAAAKNAYAAVEAGRMAGLRLTAELAKAFPPQLVLSFGAHLQSLGTPAWHFVENAHAYSGPVTIYRLDYPSGSGYVTFGVGDDGVVYALSFTNAPPQ